MQRASTLEELTPRVADPAAPGPHPGIGFREFVALIAAMMAMNALAIDMMLPALPAIGRSLHVPGENERQWIITAFLLGFGLFQVLYGPLSDRFGRRGVLMFGIASYVLCGIGTAIAPSFGWLLAFRVAQGTTVAATRVVTISVVRDCYGGRQMARVMSLVLMVFLAVPVLAPSLGQLVLLFVSWRGLFAILAGYGLLVLAWMMLRLPETLHPDYRRPFAPRALVDAFRLSLGNRLSVGYMLAQTALAGAMFGFINSVQQLFADAFHRPALMPGVFAGIAGTMALASLVNARIVERFGTRRVSHAALIGYVVFELGHVALAAAGLETIWTFAVAQALTMFCFSLSSSNFNAIAMEPLAAVAGTAASVQGFVSTVGGALAGFAIGQSFDGTTLPVTAGFAAAGVAALLCVLVTERGRLFRPQMGA